MAEIVRIWLRSLFAAAALAQVPATPVDRDAHWRQDLKFFAAEFARGQKDFAKLYPRTTFDAELAGLQADVSTLSDAEITLRLMRLVASANVAHTSVQFPTAFGFFRRLPITLYWYRDGLGVAGAAPEYAGAIGTQVLKIGTQTPEQLLAALAPYISHENDGWLRELAPAYLVTLAMAQHLGLAGSEGRVVFTLAKPDGVPFTLSMDVADPRMTQLTIAQAPHLPAPLFRSQLGRYYWRQYLADSQTLYIQYSRCRSDPKFPFSGFVREVLDEADSHPVQRVVLDLRENGGGDSRVINPLKRGLAARLKLRGRLFVLIGPKTTSSALWNAFDLRHDLHATLVGATAGHHLNHYGSVKLLTLPNSQLKIQYASKYFTLTKDAKQPLLEPDLDAPTTLADDIAGRDPALAAALSAPLH
jgi:hypothetical protein